MRSSIFLDTNGWIILLNATERLHTEALNLWLDLANRGRGFVLTDWVIAETGNGLARTRNKRQFSEVVQQMMESPIVDIVPIDHELLRRALTMYVGHSDKAWGLVDCASFLVMQERGITEAFTSDCDFEQAGFSCLLSV